MEDERVDAAMEEGVQDLDAKRKAGDCDEEKRVRCR